LRGRARRGAGRPVAAPSEASIPDHTLLELFALYAWWGSAIPAMKVMVETVPPLGGAALVFLLAGLVLVVAARGRPTPTRVQLRHLAVAGVLLLVGGQGLAIVALTEVTASLGAILAATIPLWVVLLGGLIGTPVSVASKVAARGWVRRHRDRGADGAEQRDRRGAVGGRGVLRRADSVGGGEPGNGPRRSTCRSRGRHRGSAARRWHRVVAARIVARRARSGALVGRQLDVDRGGDISARLRLARRLHALHTTPGQRTGAARHHLRLCHTRSSAP